MRKSRKILDRCCLGFVVFWVVIVQALCMLLLEPHYREFISSIGAFFIPLMSSLGIIFGLLYVFVFKYPTIQELRAKLADVFKKGNIQKDDFDKIAVCITDALENQTEVEYKEEVKILEEKKEIKEKKVELKQIENSIIMDVAKDVQMQKEIANGFKDKVKNSMETY